MPQKKIDKEVIDHLTNLSQIEMTEEERAKLTEDLDSILNYVSELNEVETTDVVPLSYIFEDLVPYIREDEICETLTREKFLENSPDQIAGLVRFPQVLKSSN